MVDLIFKLIDLIQKKKKTFIYSIFYFDEVKTNALHRNSIYCSITVVTIAKDKMYKNIILYKRKKNKNKYLIKTLL